MATNNNAKQVNKHTNLVTGDGVIKEQAALEYETRERWREKWGYMADMNEGCMEIAREKGISPEEYKRMITRRKGPKLPAVSTWDPSSSGPMPRTTAGEVGWRSAKSGCNLEHFGHLYISPRFTMEPPDSKEITKYNCIFLG